MADQPLSDIKVVDLTQNIAGPYCTKLLADYGADVIKVEPPGGDPGRSMGPFAGDDPHPDKSLPFLHLNTNKLGITLNLKTETGKRLVKALVKDADIVVESFRPGVMASLGLSYDELTAINPNLIMASISNFGQDGPYRDYKATEITLAAMATRMCNFGFSDREPLKIAGEQLQYHAGSCATMAIIFACYGREYGDLGGQYIDVSLYEALMNNADFWVPFALVRYAYTGERGGRQGEARGGVGYPEGAYPTKDGFIRVQGGRRYFPRVAAVVGRPELGTDPRFSGRGQYNQASREEFESTIWLPWLREHTSEEVLAEGLKHDMLCGMLNTIDRAVTSSHFEGRGYFVEIEHPVAGKFKYPGAPFGPYQAAHDWWRVRHPAPTLGQHNEDVLCGRLGYAKEDMVRLRERGII